MGQTLQTCTRGNDTHRTRPNEGRRQVPIYGVNLAPYIVSEVGQNTSTSCRIFLSHVLVPRTGNRNLRSINSQGNLSGEYFIHCAEKVACELDLDQGAAGQQLSSQILTRKFCHKHVLGVCGSLRRWSLTDYTECFLRLPPTFAPHIRCQRQRAGVCRGYAGSPTVCLDQVFEDSSGGVPR